MGRTPAERVRSILSERGAEDESSVSSADFEFDLHVHSLFCQMDVLCHFEDGEMGWKEAARFVYCHHHDKGADPVAEGGGFGCSSPTPQPAPEIFFFF